MSIIPLPYRLLIMAAIIAAVWVVGDLHGTSTEGLKKDEEIAQKDRDYSARIDKANTDLIAANKRASEASGGATVDQSKIKDAYDKGKSDGQKAANDRLADRTSGRQRLRVDAICTPNTGGGGAVPGTAAAAGGSDAAAVLGVVELRPDAAGRVTSATAQVEALARQLVAVQALAQSEHDRCNQGNAPAPVAPTSQADDVAHKRSILGLGVPNPFGAK